jgi:hypothetical protein
MTAFAYWVCTWTFSEGSRSGYLIKISKKGVVFKSYEGELNLGGVDISNGLEGNIWSFTIFDQEIVKKIEQLEGDKVKLYYKERYKTLPWQGDTNYIVTDIEKLEP